MSIRRCQTHRYKGLPRIDLDKVREIKNYFVYFIGSDDKVKPDKPYSLYAPISGRPWLARLGLTFPNDNVVIVLVQLQKLISRF